MIWCRHCSGNEEVQVKCGCLDKFYVWTTMGKCVTRASSECVLISLKWKSPVIYRRDRNRWSCLFTTCPYWLSSENDDADVCCDDELCAIRSIGSNSWWPCLLLCQYVEQYSRVTSFIFAIFLHVYSASEHPSKAHTVASRASRQDKHCKSGEMNQAQLMIVSEHVRTTSCQNKRTLKSKALRPTSYWTLHGYVVCQKWVNATQHDKPTTGVDLWLEPGQQWEQWPQTTRENGVRMIKRKYTFIMLGIA